MANFNPKDYDDFYDDSPSQPPQKPPKKPMSTGKKIGIGCAVIAGVIILLLVIMFGCTATMIGSSSSSSDTEKKSEYSVGEAIDADGVKITLESVERFPGTEYTKPQDGFEYVVLNWSIVNDSDEDFSPALLTYTVYADSSTVNESITSGYTGTYLPSDELIPGTKSEGSRVYEVPVGWTTMQVRINSLFGEDYTINVSPDQVTQTQ